MAISKQQAQAMWEYYDKLIGALTEASIKLTVGGAKSYTINDRSLTKFDLDTIRGEIEAAVLKRAEYDALRNGRQPRKAFGVIPRNW